MWSTAGSYQCLSNTLTLQTSNPAWRVETVCIGHVSSFGDVPGPCGLNFCSSPDAGSVVVAAVVAVVYLCESQRSQIADCLLEGLMNWCKGK